MVNIVEYTDEKEQVIALLRELQEHLVAVDGEKVQILRDEYGKDYFDYLFRLVNDNDGKIFLAKTSDSVFGMIAGYVEPKDAEDRISNRCPKRFISYPIWSLTSGSIEIKRYLRMPKKNTKITAIAYRMSFIGTLIHGVSSSRSI